jgi:DNA repair protein RadC
MRHFIRELPLTSQPHHRLNQMGAAALSDAELLSLLIARPDGLALAHELLTTFGSINQILQAEPQQLQAISGIGEGLMNRLRAIHELNIRCSQTAEELPETIHNPASAARHFIPKLGHLKREELWVMFLSTKCHVLGLKALYKGSLNQSVVRVAEVFQQAFAHNAYQIILAHNHPSGDISPSHEDVKVTNQIAKAGKLLDLQLVDHLIIAKKKWYSLKDGGLLRD